MIFNSDTLQLLRVEILSELLFINSLEPLQLEGYLHCEPCLHGFTSLVFIVT